VSSQRLELLVHNAPEARHFRKLNKVAPALAILALAMIGAGTVLFVLRNLVGLGLLFGGLVLGLLIVGGPTGWGGGRGDSAGSRRAMLRGKVEEEEKERKRRTGGED
jgi:hypothetical protein